MVASGGSAGREARTRSRAGIPTTRATAALLVALFAVGPRGGLADEEPPAPEPARSAVPAEAVTAEPGERIVTTDARERLARELDAELARASSALETLDASRLDEARESLDAETREALDRAAAMQVELASIEPGSRDAGRLYAEAVAELVATRVALANALEELDAPSAFRPFETPLDLETLAASTVAGRAAELARLRDEIAGRVTEYRAAESRLRRERVRARWDVVRQLDAVRTSAIERMPARERRRVLGVTRDGIAQLERELGQVALGVRAHARIRSWRIRAWLDDLRDPFVAGVAAWIAFKLSLVVGLFGIALGRAPRIGEWIARRVRRRRGRLQPSADAWLAVVGAALYWLVILAGLITAWRAVEPHQPWNEIRLAWHVACLYVLYRLLADVLTRSGQALAQRYRLDLGKERTRLFSSSVRLALRVALSIAIVLTVSSRWLGEGYLHHVLVRLSVIAAVITGLVIFLRWRRDIANGYLALERRGRLAPLVERTRDRWYGGFVALLALLALTGRAALTLAREFVLGFNHTRRALAFLFRRRIEKRAADTGYAEPAAIERLPAPLVTALTEEPLSDDRMTVDHFPGLADLQTAISEWRNGGIGGSFLLAGAYGVGRTTWLGRIRRDDLPVERVTFDRRLDTPGRVASALGEALDLGLFDETAPLASSLLDGPPRVIVVDRGQNLFLGRVGGYSGFESFMTLVEGTTEKVFWVVTFSQFAWEHIASVHPELARFRSQQVLEPWSEELIATMIRTRIAASGVDVRFDDLVRDARAPVSRAVQTDEAEEGFLRLLWDHSLGLPRVALTYWLRSLVPDGESRVRVRLFRSPPSDRLEGAGDAPLFLLAAITVHESLSVAELSVVTRYPEALCRIEAARLESLGILRRDGGRLWITSYWQPVVLRLLKRQNLLSD